MEMYIGTTIIKAEPQTKDGVEGFNVFGDKGFITWVEKNTFEKAKLLTEMMIKLMNTDDKN